jgi:hypothetical protein
VKRIIITLCVFLLLGAVVNVAVAWGCVFWSPIDWKKPIERDGTVPLPVIQYVPPSFFVAGSDADYVSYTFRQDRSIGIELLQFGVFEQRGSTLRMRADRLLHVEHAGWPISSLNSVGLIDLDESESWRHAVPIPSSWNALDAGSFWFRDYKRALPIGPVWPGFAINTFFYAAILWLLFAAPGRVRRWRRSRRGLCANCAYPVGASDVCTECGEVIKRGSRGLPSPAPPASDTGSEAKE